MKTKYTLLLTIVTAVMAGCAVGPNYQKPVVSTPPQWSEPLAGGETNGAAEVAAWWKNFQDPELDALISRAVQSNLDLKIAQSRVREARAQYSIAAAEFLPTVNADGHDAKVETTRHQPVLGSIPVPPGTPYQNDDYEAGFDASWELDVFGGTRRATEAARADVAATEYGRRATVVTLLGEVARNYVDLRGYQRRLAIANENIAAQARALTITQERYTNGLTSELDVQQASTLLATTKAEVPTLQSALQASIHRLSVLMAQPPGALVDELSKVQPIPAAPPIVPVGLPSELLLRRPDVQSAERQLAAATASIGVAKADLFPKFFITGAAGVESISTADLFTGGSTFWQIGPSVQWRIFDAGQIRGHIKVQNALQEQALDGYEETVLTAFEEVENSLVAYANEQVRRKTLADAVASSQRSLDLANRLYASGLTDFLHVLDAERSLYEVQDAMVESDRTVSANLIALYKSLGGGWEGLEKTTVATTTATGATPEARTAMHE